MLWFRETSKKIVSEWLHRFQLSTFAHLLVDLLSLPIASIHMHTHKEHYWDMAATNTRLLWVIFGGPKRKLEQSERVHVIQLDLQGERISFYCVPNSLFPFIPCLRNTWMSFSRLTTISGWEESHCQLFKRIRSWPARRASLSVYSRSETAS